MKNKVRDFIRETIHNYLEKYDYSEHACKVAEYVFEVYATWVIKYYGTEGLD